MVIGGLKVVTAQGWFAVRASGTENVYKLYAESFRGSDHLQRIQQEAQAITSSKGRPKDTDPDGADDAAALREC
jgi:phosphoglucomutase